MFLTTEFRHFCATVKQTIRRQLVQLNQVALKYGRIKRCELLKCYTN